MQHLLNYFRSGILSLNLQNAFILSHKKRKLIFIAGLAGIILWQLIYVFKPCIKEDYRRKETTGFAHENARHFFYFYYYLDLFPVATSAAPLTYSKEGALNTLQEHGNSLVMEWNHWSRLGENARILLYLPKAYITGSAKYPSIMPFSAIAFILSLVLVYCAFWKHGQPLLGFFIVLFLGSNPFLLYETYARPNIFALLAVNTLLILAINLPFFKKTPVVKKNIWLLPVISGGILGTAVHIRGENSMVLVSCLFIYLTISNFKMVHKLGLCLVCLLSFATVVTILQNYFDKKFKEAHSIVSNAGGHPYNGHRGSSHSVWHPVFCGLGDYDTKYGYKWTDQTAYNYALPILKEKHNLSLAYSGGYILNEYYDAKKKYYKKIELFKEYDEVIKNKVITDISNDPLWYLEILAKRVIAVFTNTSPVWLKLGKIEVPLPINGLLVIPFIILLFVWKKWFELRLLLFSFPLAITSILIYSKGNTTYNSCFHLFFAALLAAWIAEFVFSQINQHKNHGNNA